VDAKKLVTLTFEKNVGTLDRAQRLVVGTVVSALGWTLGWPRWGAIALTVLGAMWVLTGVLSKCSIYYILGYSTCPVSGEPLPRRAS
jgi:hypothetical protein